MLGWALFLVSLAVGAAITQWQIIEGNKQKTQAKEDAAEIKTSLDTLLGAEQGKLTTEYEAQQKRLTEYKETILGSQRQGLAVRGDFGGEDTAAARILQATENKAAEDMSFLGKEHQAGLDVLSEQTKLAKSQLDSNLHQYLSAITANQIASISNFINNSLSRLGSMELPMKPTLLDAPGAVGDYRYPMPGAGWDPARGIPRLN